MGNLDKNIINSAENTRNTETIDRVLGREKVVEKSFDTRLIDEVSTIADAESDNGTSTVLDGKPIESELIDTRRFEKRLLAVDTEVLADKIVNFCFDYGIFDMWNSYEEIKHMVIIGLEKEEFIENLVSTILTRMRACHIIEIDRLTEILARLEIIRTRLEFKGHGWLERKGHNSHKKWSD